MLSPGVGKPRESSFSLQSEPVTFSTLQLKPLTIADLPAALELDQCCLGGLWSLAGYQREIESPNSDLLLLSRAGAGQDRPELDRPELDLSQQNRAATDSALGLACLWRIVDEAHLTLLAVHPMVQRQGLGQLLLYALLLKARETEMNRATLEVRASNQGAIALYQKFGFELAGRRRGYYAATQEDALIFWRSGLQTPNFALELDAWKAMLFARLAQSGWQWCK